MKKIISIFLSVLMAVSFLGVSGFAAYAENDSIANADYVNLGTQYNYELSSENTADYFKFTITSSSKVNLTFTAEIHQMNVNIYDENNNHIFGGFSSDDGLGQIKINSDIHLIKGTYYLKASTYNNYYGNYSFKITAASANESFEEEVNGHSNNTVSDAETVGIGNEYKGQLAKNDSEDYYKFAITSSSKVNLTFTAEMQQMNVIIYDEDNKQIFGGYRSDGGLGQIKINSDINLIKGTYYLKASTYNSYHGNYSFKITATSANETFEEEVNGHSNNTFSTADSITLGNEFTGQLAENDGADYYVFSKSNEEPLNLSVKTKFQRMYLYIYDSNFNKVHGGLYNNDSGEVTVDEDVDLPSGTYYLVFSTSDGRCGNYDFCLSVKCDHSFVQKVLTPATCTSEGVVKYTCSKCSFSKTESIPKLDHTVVIEAAVAATCTHTGLTQGSYCSACGERFTAQQTVPALGHSYISSTTAPTCKEQGYTTYTCNRCGYSYNTDYTGIVPHNVVTDSSVAATCTRTGLTQGSHCSACGEVFTAQQVLPALSHAYISSTTAPTCTEQGYTTYTCNRCGDSYTDDYVAATGHTAVTQAAVDATCTQTGLTQGSYCSVCGEVLDAQQTVPELGHDGVGVTTAPTCTEKGYTTYTCKRCGETYVDDYVNALGHKNAKAVKENEVASTCSKEGSYDEVVYCSVCKKEVRRTKKTVKKTAHNFKEGKCTVCNASDEYVDYETSIDKDVYKYGESWSSTITLKLNYKNSVKTVTVNSKPSGFKTSGSDESKLERLTGCTFTYDGTTYELKNDIVLTPYYYCYVKDFAFNTESGKMMTKTVYLSKDTEYEFFMMYNSRSIFLSSKAKQYLDVDYDGASFGTMKVSLKTAAIPANSNNYYIILRGKNGSQEFKTKIIFRYRPSITVKAKKKAIGVSWDKAANVSGYQIQLATNSSFSKGKKLYTVSSSTLTKTISSLKGKKTYYVHVRAYKTVNGSKVYTNWSTYKKVKTK